MQEGYSEDEYASDGDGYGDESYEDEADGPANGPGRPTTSECAAERIEAAADRDAAEYEDEFEASDGDSKAEGDDTQGLGCETHNDEGKEEDGDDAGIVSQAAGGDEEKLQDGEGEDAVAPLNSSTKPPRQLVSSRSFSVPAVPSVRLPASDISQRSASVPTVPLAAIGRLAKGYEDVNDGENSPRARHELVPLPVVDEANGINLSEQDEESESDSELENSSELGTSGEDPGTVRMRALSLQHTKQQSVTLPARKSKSQLYLRRLPSVSEQVAEDVAAMALPAALTPHGEPPSPGSFQKTAINLNEGAAKVNATAAHDAYPVQDDMMQTPSTFTSVDISSITDDQHAIAATSEDPIEIQTGEASIPRRETEQLMWEIQSLIKAQREDFAKDQQSGIIGGIAIPNEMLREVGESAAIAISSEEDAADQYGEEEFSDDSEQSGQDDLYFSDDEVVDAQVMSRHAENLEIYSVADMDEDNRRETEALLQEAQSLLQAAAYSNININNGSRPESAGYGEDEEFDDDEDTAEMKRHQDVAEDRHTTDDTYASPDTVMDVLPSCNARQSEASSDQESPGELSSNIVATCSDAESPNVMTETLEANEHNSDGNRGAQPNEHTQSTSHCNTQDDFVTETQMKPHPPPKKTVSTPQIKPQEVERTSPRPTPPVRHTRKRLTVNPDTREHGGNPIRQKSPIEPAKRGSSKSSAAVNAAENVSQSPIHDANHPPASSRSTHGSPPKVSSPRPDEYPVLPRKDPVPKQMIPKKRMPPDCRRELKPVKSPSNLRINIPGVDKAKRDWLFLNMFRHGDNVSKYEPFVPKSAFSRPPPSSIATRPQTADSNSSLNDVSPYAYGGRRLRKPEDPALIAREKNWVASKPHDCAIPTYDSILDKYCATVTSPVIQRQIYQTRYQDLSPQLAFVLEKRVERQWKESHRPAEACISYLNDPSPPE